MLKSIRENWLWILIPILVVATGVAIAIAVTSQSGDPTFVYPV